MYLKVADTGSGLSLSISSRQPRWLAAGHPRGPRARLCARTLPRPRRMGQALDLLHECYPSAAAPAATPPGLAYGWNAAIAWVPDGAERVLEEHDALVMGIVEWLAGALRLKHPATARSRGQADPLPLPAAALRGRSANARSQGATAQRAALLSIVGGGHVLAVRRTLAGRGNRRRCGSALNIVWTQAAGGRDCPSPLVAEEIEKAGYLVAPAPCVRVGRDLRRGAAEMAVVVPQRNLDRLLASAAGSRE